MFKKISSGLLILILIALLAVYFIVRFAGQKERTFKDKVLSFDPALVTNILIINPSQEEPVELQLSGNRWDIVSKGKTYQADSSLVKGILRQLSDLPTKRFAGKGNDSWEKYELTDDMATMVTIKSGAKTIAEIYIGKFSYSIPKGQQQSMQMRQQQGDMTTFVRLADEPEVYAVEGFLKMNFNRETGAYRFKGLANVNPDEIIRLVFDENDRKSTLENINGIWYLNGSPADSVKAARYCSSIARVSGSKFADDGDYTSTPARMLTLEGNNFSPIQIKAFPVADTNVNYIITSSINPESYFNGKEGKLFDRIFREWSN